MRAQAYRYELSAAWDVSGRPRLALYQYQATSDSGEEVPVIRMATSNQAGPHAATNLVQAITIELTEIAPAEIVPGTSGPLLSR
jgi:hypothetical protein